MNYCGGSLIFFALSIHGPLKTLLCCVSKLPFPFSMQFSDVSQLRKIRFRGPDKIHNVSSLAPALSLIFISFGLHTQITPYQWYVLHKSGCFSYWDLRRILSLLDMSVSFLLVYLETPLHPLMEPTSRYFFFLIRLKEIDILMITWPKDYCKSIELILTIRKNLFSLKHAEWLFLFQQRQKQLNFASLQT